MLKLTSLQKGGKIKLTMHSYLFVPIGGRVANLCWIIRNFLPYHQLLTHPTYQGCMPAKVGPSTSCAYEPDFLPCQDMPSQPHCHLSGSFEPT